MYQSKLCAGITPYQAGEQPQDKRYLKLNTNENPFSPSPGVASLLANFDTDSLKLYPDPDNRALKKTIAASFGVSEQEVFVGNGSDEVLALCYPTFFDSDGGGVCFADVTYSFYPVFAAMYSIPQRIVPLTASFEYDFEAMLATDSQGFLICNPNAPTAVAVEKERLLDFISAVGNRLVIVDEAYADFSNISIADLAVKYPNVLVVRTFSKSYSLAGMRIGYAIGNSALIASLNTIKNCFNSYTVNRLSEQIAIEAMQDKEYFTQCISKVAQARAFLSLGLTKLGFTVLPSAANFIFAAPPTGVEAGSIYSALKANGILVRYFNKPRINGFLRISIGTQAQCEALLRALEQLL